MSVSFGEKWKEYVNLFWKRVSQKMSITPPILLWGHVTYQEFKQSKFYIPKPIMSSDPIDKVYFFLRTHPKSGDLCLFFFLPVPGLDQFLRKIRSVDALFILDLLYFEFDLSTLFEHEFAQDCWNVLIQTEHINFV